MIISLKTQTEVNLFDLLDQMDNNERVAAFELIYSRICQSGKFELIESIVEKHLPDGKIVIDSIYQR